jgi:hypothetical protein
VTLFRPLPFFVTNATYEPSQTSNRPSATMESTCSRPEVCPSTRTPLKAAPAPLVGAL